MYTEIGHGESKPDLPLRIRIHEMREAVCRTPYPIYYWCYEPVGVGPFEGRP
jgi:hypothetical protein